jgi:hypothetical protein
VRKHSVPSNCRGQSTTEAMIVMSFLMLLLFASMHFAMFAVTKYMVNLAAFAAARTAMVGGNEQQAAEQVMSNLDWWRDSSHKPVLADRALSLRGKGRNGILVTSTVPFAFPFFASAPAGGTRVIGFSPAVDRPGRGAADRGDNAAP